MSNDTYTRTLHPTKGWRRISDKRARAASADVWRQVGRGTHLLRAVQLTRRFILTGL